jgi:cytochrome c biogenesis protein CcmG/thiol:disulfide interchange protein DsbE
MRRFVVPLAALAVLAVVVIGLIQASGGTKAEPLPPFHLDRALADLRGAPAPLAALHAQHSQLLGGGTQAFERRLHGLRGHPVVINKWGSWCTPCRQEFPVFQHASTDLGKRVAFVGVDIIDNAGKARDFLRDFPLPYPSFSDPHGVISQAIHVPGGAAPITLFLDARGRTAFIHQGPYKSVAALKADVDRYL